MTPFARVLAALTLVLLPGIHTRRLAGDPPELMQWQRQIEEDRVEDALRKGNTEEALTLAKELVREYKRATTRQRHKGGVTRGESLPQIIRLNYLLATTARIAGDQEMSRSLFEQIEKDCLPIEAEMMRRTNQAQLAANMFAASYLQALEDYDTLRVREERGGITVISRGQSVNGVLAAASALSTVLPGF